MILLEINKAERTTLIMSYNEQKPIITIISVLILIFLISCGRIPSEQRFEENTGIVLPKDIQVTRDDYFELIQDYEILYTADFTDEQEEYLIRQIIASNGNWTEINKGYEYQLDNERLQVSVIIDTIANNLEYHEGYD